MEQIRVLIVHSNPAFGEDLARSLKTLKSSFGDHSVEAFAVATREQEWRDTVAKRAKEKRAHFVIVDKSLLRNDEDAHQLLRKSVLPASCILLAPAGTITVASALHAFYSQVLLAPGHRLASAAKLIVPMIERDLRDRYAQQQNINLPRLLLREAGKALGASEDEIREVFECFFPSAQTVVVGSLQIAQANSVPRIHRGKSVFLSVSVEDDLAPVVVKLAPRQCIEDETKNFPMIESRLRGMLHARLERSTALWDIGAVMYSLIGTELDKLVTFARYYRSSLSVDSISEVLKGFFGNSWAMLYRDTHRHVKPPESMFSQYDKVWKGRVGQRLPSRLVGNQQLSFPGVPFDLPNPLHWLDKNRDKGMIRDSRQAVTHGDLHGDNLMVDKEREFCWAIDFERSGMGPILRDFTELECDIVTRIMEVPNDDLSGVFGTAIALARLKSPSDPFIQPKARLSFADDAARVKAFGVLSFLRGQRHASTRYREATEYLWGLLLNAVFLSLSLPEDSPQWKKAMLLGGVLASRLDEYDGNSTLWPRLLEWQDRDSSRLDIDPPIIEEGEKMDYERGLNSLRELAAGADWDRDFATYEAELRRVLREERRLGPGLQTNQDRNRVIHSLNALALEKLGVSFTDLCLGRRPTIQTQHPEDAKVTELLDQILKEIRQGRIGDQETAKQILEALLHNRIEQAESAKIMSELQAWARGIEREGLPLSPELKKAVDALTEHSGSAYQYMQLALPIIPGILSYNVELGSQHQANLRSIWRKISERFGKKRGELPEKAGATDTINLQSLPINSGKAWALLVGVDHYDDRHIGDLNVCVADVAAIQQSLSRGYEIVKLLSDATAERLPTRANILGELSAVAQAAAEDDLLLFYFSGHGVADAGESYLLPREAHITALKRTGVSMGDVREVMDKSPARAKVIILDACHSGEDIGKAETVMTEEFVRRVFEQAEGMAVLASCKQGQRSWLWPEKGHSVFSYFLLQALAGEADFDKKGFVTVSDVNRYVTDRVKQWATDNGAPQTPTLHYSVAGDIVLLQTRVTE